MIPCEHSNIFLEFHGLHFWKNLLPRNAFFFFMFQFYFQYCQHLGRIFPQNKKPSDVSLFCKPTLLQTQLDLSKLLSPMHWGPCKNSSYGQRKSQEFTFLKQFFLVSGKFISVPFFSSRNVSTSTSQQNSWQNFPASPRITPIILADLHVVVIWL